MNKKLFVDSDVVLDVLAKRSEFYEHSAIILTLGDIKKVRLFTTSLAIANVYYILKKILGAAKTKDALRKLRAIMSVIPITEKNVDLSLNSRIADFEDALQYFAAIDNHADCIITRNTRDYKNLKIIAQTPKEYIQSLKE